MKTTWKSYFVFLSTSYKIWGMIFFPMVILGITELFIYDVWGQKLRFLFLQAMLWHMKC